MLQFGTDGVRGHADADLDRPFVFALGRAIARVLGAQPFLLGRDTRESGPRIEHDLATGLTYEGASPLSLGVMPTPAIAYLAARRGAPAAIVSASHNPWTDNGVKVVGADGRKLDDEQERAIEAQLHLAAADAPAVADDVASVPAVTGAVDDYVGHLLSALDGRTLHGLAVVLDCANGAASEIAPWVFSEAGADVEVLHASPDGQNINARCGSTHPDDLRRAVVARSGALGLAFDGDADRVVAVDEHGDLVDGDQIMTMTALDLRARGRLHGDAVAVTVMSNLGLRRALADAGIAVVETPVGDRHVVAAMQERGLSVGGEQSGHIVYADYATTGDGLLTGLFVCDLVARSGAPLSSAARVMTRFPQVLVNVRVPTLVDPLAIPGVRDEVRALESRLGDHGRVLVRASGTEPLVRIMVEAESEAEAAQGAERLRRAVEGAARV